MQLWNEELVQQISSHPSVERVVALGTLFALELRAEGDDVGYCDINLFLYYLLYTNSGHGYSSVVVWIAQQTCVFQHGFHQISLMLY